MAGVDVKEEGLERRERIVAQPEAEAAEAPPKPERAARPIAPRTERVSRFDVPYPTRSRPSAGDDAPRVFDVESPSAPPPPAADPDATTMMRRPDPDDEPGDAA